MHPESPDSQVENPQRRWFSLKPLGYFSSAFKSQDSDHSHYSPPPSAEHRRIISRRGFLRLMTVITSVLTGLQLSPRVQDQNKERQTENLVIEMSEFLTRDTETEDYLLHIQELQAAGLARPLNAEEGSGFIIGSEREHVILDFSRVSGTVRIDEVNTLLKAAIPNQPPENYQQESGWEAVKVGLLLQNANVRGPADSSLTFNFIHEIERGLQVMESSFPYTIENVNLVIEEFYTEGKSSIGPAFIAGENSDLTLNNVVCWIPGGESETVEMYEGMAFTEVAWLRGVMLTNTRNERYLSLKVGQSSMFRGVPWDSITSTGWVNIECDGVTIVQHGAFGDCTDMCIGGGAGISATHNGPDSIVSVRNLNARTAKGYWNILNSPQNSTSRLEVKDAYIKAAVWAVNIKEGISATLENVTFTLSQGNYGLINEQDIFAKQLHFSSLHGVILINNLEQNSVSTKNIVMKIERNLSESANETSLLALSKIRKNRRYSSFPEMMNEFVQLSNGLGNLMIEDEKREVTYDLKVSDLFQERLETAELPFMPYAELVVLYHPTRGVFGLAFVKENIDEIDWEDPVDGYIWWSEKSFLTNT